MQTKDNFTADGFGAEVFSFKILKRFVKLKPTLNELNYKLGTLYYNNEEYKESMSYLREYALNNLNDYETNINGVYAVGDCAGLGGAYAACEEGIIAGIHAVLSLGFKITKKQEDEYSISKSELKTYKRITIKNFGYNNGYYYNQRNYNVKAKVDSSICHNNSKLRRTWGKKYIDLIEAIS